MRDTPIIWNSRLLNAGSLTWASSGSPWTRVIIINYDKQSAFIGSCSLGMPSWWLSPLCVLRGGGAACHHHPPSLGE